jgi:hypothetical protein
MVIAIESACFEGDALQEILEPSNLQMITVKNEIEQCLL